MEELGQGRVIVEIRATEGFLLVTVSIVTKYDILGHPMAARGLRPIPVRVVHFGRLVSKPPSQTSLSLPRVFYQDGWS